MNAPVGVGETRANNGPSQSWLTGLFKVVERAGEWLSRSITVLLHVTADSIDASFEDGVLRVVVAKAAEAKPKPIEVVLAQHVDVLGLGVLLVQ